MFWLWCAIQDHYSQYSHTGHPFNTLITVCIYFSISVIIYNPIIWCHPEKAHFWVWFLSRFILYIISGRFFFLATAASGLRALNTNLHPNFSKGHLFIVKSAIQKNHWSDYNTQLLNWAQTGNMRCFLNACCVYHLIFLGKNISVP